MRVISCMNFKGGVGKSSMVENLSHALAMAGQRVLVIDADRQGNASTTLLAGRRTPTLTQFIQEQVTLEEVIYQARENLYVIPSDTNLDEGSSYLNTHPEAFELLKESVQELTGYDIVLCDHAGAYTPVMRAVLLASQEMLVPVELEPYATQGLFSMFDKLKRTLRKHVIRNAGIIPYNVDLRYAMSRKYLSELRETFGELITSVVRTDSTVPRAQSLRKTVFEYDQKSRVAEDFRTLAEDLIAEAQEATP
jgi:chromosome partitioning protein